MVSKENYFYIDGKNLSILNSCGKDLATSGMRERERRREGRKERERKI